MTSYHSIRTDVKNAPETEVAVFRGEFVFAHERGELTPRRRSHASTDSTTGAALSVPP